MPKGGGEYIHHITSVRLRVDGSGELDMTLYGINDIKNFPVQALTLTDPCDIEPTKLVNFRSQRTRLKFGVNVINEYFEIFRIIMFIKASATSYPM